MIRTFAWPALATCVALAVYIWTIAGVGGARRASGIGAPATTGDLRLETALRVQMNTLESLAVFLPSLWMAALFWNHRLVALIALLWSVGRVLYGLGYRRAPGARAPGFYISSAAGVVLLLMALVGAVRVLLATGGV